MLKEINAILKHIKENYNKDFLGCDLKFTEEIIKKRMQNNNSLSINDYSNYYLTNIQEQNTLIKSLTIPVSFFFRYSFLYEYLANFLLPELLSEKKSKSIRIWSAGCATGEEPYTIAIILKELLKYNFNKYDIRIFGTDIDESSLKKAQDGIYKLDKLENVKHGLIKKYFEKLHNNYYAINNNIKKLVNFHYFDLLDAKNYIPPECIYGDFDIVLCCNVIIYYNDDYKNKIYSKLHKSLGDNNFLVLGDEEIINNDYKHFFTHKFPILKIYSKNA